MGLLGRLFGKGCAEHPLKAMALKVTAEEIGVEASAERPKVFGVLMDQKTPPFTLACFADGSSSLYWGSNGGIIGAGEHAPVREAAEKLLAVAQSAYDHASATPPEGDKADAKFLLRGFEGDRYGQIVSIKEAMGKPHPQAALFIAAQGVITQIRLVEAGRR